MMQYRRTNRVLRHTLPRTAAVGAEIRNAIKTGSTVGAEATHWVSKDLWLV